MTHVYMIECTGKYGDCTLESIWDDETKALVETRTLSLAQREDAEFRVSKVKLNSTDKATFYPEYYGIREVIEWYQNGESTLARNSHAE
jgi:hypothetical protein